MFPVETSSESRNFVPCQIKILSFLATIDANLKDFDALLLRLS